jgi:hypothetical protein
MLSPVACGLFGLFVACSNVGSSEGGSDFDPIPEDELPEQASAAVCELLFGCDCENPGYADEPQCVEDLMQENTEAQMAAQEAGLSYDPDCAGDQVGAYLEHGCSPELLDVDCDGFCQAYHGEVQAGGSCTIVSGTFWSDCAQGLLCLNGTCDALCDDELLGEGDACLDDQGESLGACDSEQGLLCDYESGTCKALPGPGEPCFGGEVCAAGAICDFQNGGVCIAAPKEGDPCEFQCDRGLYCDNPDGMGGTCMALPGEGEPCYLGQACEEGLTCDADGMCATPDPAVCPGPDGAGG